MISTGNDIIALQYTNPERTKQEKFYSKIICKQEAELFKSLNSDVLPFENFVWLSWSIKESVYKFYKRSHPESLFQPTKIIIQKIQFPINNFLLNDEEHEAVSFADEACFCCVINFNNQSFYTRSFIKDDLIFTVANNTNDFKNICWGIKTIGDDVYQTQSTAVRQFVLKRLHTFFFNTDLSIEKAKPVILLSYNKKIFRCRLHIMAILLAIVFPLIIFEV